MGAAAGAPARLGRPPAGVSPSALARRLSSRLAIAAYPSSPTTRRRTASRCSAPRSASADVTAVRSSPSAASSSIRACSSASSTGGSTPTRRSARRSACPRRSASCSTLRPIPKTQAAIASRSAGSAAKRRRCSKARA
jgi:hypothetical protein